MTFDAEDIADRRDQDVLDAAGDKVGTLDAIYFDTAADEPTFATVRIGMVGRHKLVFVPLADAVVAPTFVQVTAGKKLIKNAPSIRVDGELAAAEEPDVFRHYGLVFRPGAGGERRLARR